MVDTTDKTVTDREATASGRLLVSDKIMSRLREDGYQNKKGSITQTAIIAGTMAVKKTYEAIPLCHQIPISGCKVAITPDDKGFAVTCKVRCKGVTGVEMEALHGASVALLTLYDMIKALSHDMEITGIRLESKSGGKHDYNRTP